MKMTIESTKSVISANGVTARVWKGKTESGIPISVLVCDIAVPADEDQSQFQAELVHKLEPSIQAQEAFSLKYLI